MKRITVLLLVAGLLLMLTVPAVAAGQYDMWKGTFRDVTDLGAFGHVTLNYLKGQDAWRVNVVANGLPDLAEDELYQVFFYSDTSVKSELGCFTLDENGEGHWNDLVDKDDIDPSALHARINVRVADSECNGKSNSAKLTTAENRYGSGLFAVGSNRNKD